MTTWSTRSKLLANQQKDDDSLVRMIVSELLEENRRKTMDGLRLFISVDKYATVQIGDLQKDMKPKIVTEISFATDFREQLFGKTRMNSFYDHRSFVLFQPLAEPCGSSPEHTACPQANCSECTMQQFTANAQCNAPHHVDIGDADKRALANKKQATLETPPLAKLRTIQTDLDLHVCSNQRWRSHGQCHFSSGNAFRLPVQKGTASIPQEIGPH